MIHETSSCAKCGSPIFDLGAGQIVTSCTCGKVSQVTPSGNPFNKLEEHINDAYQVLKDIIALECSDDKGDLDSWGKMYFAKGIEILASRNEVEIISKKGPKIKAKWK